MQSILDLLFLRAPHKKQVTFLMLIISVVYLINFHVNDIWTPNESFYAEAVREMFESGNFLEIFYNYEPRYNKPPLTYWSIALSVNFFGMNEFAIRLPIVLMALGSIWLTYLLGKMLYGEKGGVYAMVMMSFSLQLLAVKQYASPEVPLTFFFTLTMYYFLKGFQQNKFAYILFAYIALGLTVLTKGFPYIIVIGGIIGIYVLWESEFKWRQVWTKIKFLKLHYGLLIVSGIGLSWIIFMLIKNGQEFWAVYKRETFERALNKKSNGLKPFFYIEVISWSILPYSIAFFYALLKRIKEWKGIKEVNFILSWIFVMLLIFTYSKGKIPTYMIQAHPALLLMIVPLLLSYKPNGPFWKILWRTAYLLPTIILFVATVCAIYYVELHVLYYLLPSFLLVLFYFASKKEYRNDNAVLAALPFWSIVMFLLCFSFYSPRLEMFRPYDEIGRVINIDYKIEKDVPILIQGTLIHNIPFYAQRFALRDQTIEQINSQPGKTLALIKAEDFDILSGFDSIWSGYIYDFPSESQFAKFMIASLKAEKGDYSKFALYHLVYRDISDEGISLK